MLAVAVVAGIVGVGMNPAGAQERPSKKAEAPSERNPTKSSDDENLAPGVPGVTEQNNSGMSKEQIRKVEEALQAKGHNPGRVDGVLDNDTRAAIRDFQKANNVTITGNVDDRTAQLLGIPLEKKASTQTPRERAN